MAGALVPSTKTGVVGSNPSQDGSYFTTRNRSQGPHDPNRPHLMGKLKHSVRAREPHITLLM